MRCESSTHPILMSEPVVHTGGTYIITINYLLTWLNLCSIQSNTKDKREKLCELFFEKYNAPGFYLSKNAVLSS